MTPYYQDDLITIYHGDCLEVLPGLVGIRSIVADPPYGMDWDTNGKRFSGGSPESIAKRGTGKDYGVKILNDDKPFDPAPFLDYQNVLLFGYQHFANKLPVGSILAWVKRTDAGFGSFLSDAELAWVNNGCGVYCFRDLSMNAITRDRQHPTQKPVALMRWCIQQIKDPGLICDPYTGSGSTLVAAKQLGLKAIGIEIVEDYCRVAADRVSKTGVMFPAMTPVLPELEQLELLSLQDE